MRTCLKTIVVVLGLVAAGCGPPPHDTLAALTLPPPEVGPDGQPVVTDENREGHVYAYYLARPGTIERRAEREALIRHAFERAQEAKAEDGTVDVGATLWQALRLFEPPDLVAPLDSPALRKLLAWIRPIARQAGKPEEYLAIAHAQLLLDPGDAQAASDVRGIVAVQNPQFPRVDVQQAHLAVHHPRRRHPPVRLVGDHPCGCELHGSSTRSWH